MGALTTSKIKDTYPGLIKTTDNAAINATPKALEDGLGNTLPVQVGTDGMIYTGTQDFSGATVTGIPDEDTTYTINAAQTGADVNVNLVGSDSTTDTIKLVAGTNVTLTQFGDNVTIAAAGGGGSSANYYSTVVPPLAIGANDFFKLNVPANSYGGSGFALGNGAPRYTPVFTLVEGEIIDDVAVFVQTAQASSTITLGLFTCTEISTGIYGSTLATTFGTIDSSTTGRKVITGLNYTIPASAKSIYYVGILQVGGAGNAAIYGPENTQSWSLYGALNGTIQQRAMSVNIGTGLSTLPSSISSAQWNAGISNTTYGFVGFRN